jgi:hypothetical protein
MSNTSCLIAAILEGIAKYGHGNWLLIKRNAGDRLLRRSGPQIKDKARTLSNQGKI